MFNIDWTTFKATVAAVGVPFKYYAMNSTYYLFSTDGQVVLTCIILQDGTQATEQVEFETYYAPLAVSYNISPLAPGSYRNITGNATTVVKGSAGVLMGILINENTTGGSITIYDNTAGSGTKFGTIQIGTPSGGLLSASGKLGPGGFTTLNVRLSIGLTVVTSGSANNDITVVYR